MSHYTPLFSSVRSDRRLAKLSDGALAFWFMLLAQVDAHGRISADPELLKADVCPLRSVEVGGCWWRLVEIGGSGLVAVYPCDEGYFVQIVDWEKNQGLIGRKNDRRRSKYPDPQGLTPLTLQELTDLHRSPPTSTDLSPQPQPQPQPQPEPQPQPFRTQDATHPSSCSAHKAPSEETESKPPPKPKKDRKKGPHVVLVETFQRAWAYNRCRDVLDDAGFQISAASPIDSIPKAALYVPSVADYTAADRLWKAIGGDMDTARVRLKNFFASDAEWMTNAGLSTFCAKYSQLIEPIAKLSFTGGS